MKKNLVLAAGTAALFALGLAPLAVAGPGAMILPQGGGMSVGQTSTAVPPTREATPTTLSVTFAVPTVKAGG